MFSKLSKEGEKKPALISKCYNYTRLHNSIEFWKENITFVMLLSHSIRNVFNLHYVRKKHEFYFEKKNKIVHRELFSSRFSKEISDNI